VDDAATRVLQNNEAKEHVGVGEKGLSSRTGLPRSTAVPGIDFGIDTPLALANSLPASK
jgi:hypothetical protein